MTALGSVGPQLDAVAVLTLENEQHQSYTLVDGLKEYLGLLRGLPNIVRAHESAWGEIQLKKTKMVSGFDCVSQRCHTVRPNESANDEEEERGGKIRKRVKSGQNGWKNGGRESLSSNFHCHVIHGLHFPSFRLSRS